MAARSRRDDVREVARSGSFRLELATQRWSWSDEVYAIHGLAPREVEPTTDLVMSHKHPDDRERSAAVLQRAGRTGGPFSHVYRLVDGRGRGRIVAVVGEGRGTAPDGAPSELTGFFLDVTDAVEDRAQVAAAAGIAAAVESRTVIDQAVGVVAFSRAVTPDEAFQLLRLASQDANVAVRSLARTIVDAIPTLGRDTERVTRFLDRLLAPQHRADEMPPAGQPASSGP